MMRRVCAIAFLITITAAATAAAQVRIEASLLGGYTWTTGISGKDAPAGNGQVYNGAKSVDSGSFGFQVGIAEGHGEYGFLYRRQMGALDLTGTTTTRVGDLNTDNYHGYFAYNFGDPDGRLQYYVMGGAGMTHLSDVSYTNIAGQPATLNGRSLFSATFGSGLRFMASDMIGFRFGVQWTPIYITDDPDTMFCDPYWGCYLVGNPQYMQQIDLMAGVTFRFGGK